MKNRSCSRMLVALSTLSPGLAYAQTDAEATASAQADVAAPAPVGAPAETPPATVAPTTADLQREIQALKDELVRRDDDAILGQVREAAEHDRLIHVYGFADVGGKYATTAKEGIYASRFSSPATFYLGRLNLYFDSHPAPHFRFLAETRFSLYPNGSPVGVDSSYQQIRTSTTVNDLASPNAIATQSWGGVILERAVLDWTRYPLFSVRVGLFLSPFGIYTVDHGTPTLISVALPLYLGLGWIPERQLGLQIFGSQPIDRWEAGYALTLSNGQGNAVNDVSNAKSVGGRLYLKRQGALRLQLGVSAIYQPIRRYREQFGVDASGSVTYERTVEIEYNSTTVGGDLSLDYGGLRVRSELVWYQNEYAPGKRDEGVSTLGGGFNPDERSLNWSLIVAYRWWQIEPYLLNEIFHCTPTQYMGDKVWLPGVGVNVYLQPNVILKGAWAAARFYRPNDPESLAARRNFQTMLLLLTWAF